MTEPIAFVVPGEPVPFARAGAHGKQRFTPKRQASFMGIIRMFAEQAMDGRSPFEGPVRLRIIATYLVPRSWSKIQRATAYYKASKPDADNISKIVKDSLSTIVYADDAQVADLSVLKVYGPVAEVAITVGPASARRPASIG